MFDSVVAFLNLSLAFGLNTKEAMTKCGVTEFKNIHHYKFQQLNFDGHFEDFKKKF